MIVTRLHIKELDEYDLPRPQKLSMLRGQITILRRRSEESIPITVDALERAERIARSLELQEVAP
jgi:hypothetical protein